MEVDSVATAVRWALAYLGCVRAMVARPAVVLDIDGTILVNTADGHAKCVHHMGVLVAACVSAKIAIFFVTARPDTDDNRKHTERQLARCGVNKHETLYMMPPRHEYLRYKFRARQDIISKGWNVLLAVGDQFADVSRRENLGLADDRLYVGQIGDGGSFAIKLPSEFGGQV